jgi:hypothetical protein
MDVERTIQFLLEQQARFDARQAEFAARQAEAAAAFAARQAEFAAAFATSQAEFAAEFAARQAEFEVRHAKFEAKFEEDITRINSVIVSIATSQQRTNEILVALTEKHVELAEAQRSTEHKIHTVISALERHIANHE